MWAEWLGQTGKCVDRCSGRLDMDLGGGPDDRGILRILKMVSMNERPE